MQSGKSVEMYMYVFYMCLIWFLLVYFLVNTVQSTVSEYGTRIDQRTQTIRATKNVDSDTILVYDINSRSGTGILATGINDIKILNFDGKLYVDASDTTTDSMCSKEGLVPYLRLPPPVSSDTDKRKRPDYMCLPAAIKYITESAERDPYREPAVVQLQTITGTYLVDVINTLIKTGYVKVTR